MALAPRLLAETAEIKSVIFPTDGEAARDRSAMMRGIMVDAARVPERLEFYKRVIEFCADWELNTLHFRLADDQGTALRFASAPESRRPRKCIQAGGAARPRRIRAKSRRRFASRARVLRTHRLHHVRARHTLICSTRNRRRSDEFTGMIPAAIRRRSIYSASYTAKSSRYFPRTYLHGGCDEVNWGGSALSQKGSGDKTRAQIWAEYLNALANLAEAQGSNSSSGAMLCCTRNPRFSASSTRTSSSWTGITRENNSVPLRDALANDSRQRLARNRRAGIDQLQVGSASRQRAVAQHRRLRRRLSFIGTTRLLSA